MASRYRDTFETTFMAYSQYFKTYELVSQAVPLHLTNKGKVTLYRDIISNKLEQICTTFIIVEIKIVSNNEEVVEKSFRELNEFINAIKDLENGN